MAAKTLNVPGDLLLTTEAEFRSMRNTEKQRAIELSKSLAAGLGIEEATAIACASWLERPVLTEEDTEESLPGRHTWAADSRLKSFTEKTKKLQETRNANAARN